MNIDIRDITKENLKEALSLHVNADQQTFVESPETSLKDARVCSYYQPVGLYLDSQIIGFAMYGFFPNEGETGRVWLDRFLIDKRFQGHGLGSVMLSALLKKIAGIYHSKKVYLSVFEGNNRALHLYRKFGFEFNGEYDINGEKVMEKNI